MINPLFSIITVTKNNLPGLRQTGLSLRDQTCGDYEWIIIDGDSQDGTKDYLKNLSAISISEKDNGLYDAMNKGIARASGLYSLFLNAGDSLAAEETLSLIKDALPDYPDFIYGDAWEDQAYKKAYPAHRIGKGMITHHQAMLYKTALLKNTSYKTHYMIAADYDLTWRFLKEAKTITYLPIAICRFEPNGLSQRCAQAGRVEEYIIRRLAGINGLAAQGIYLRQAAAALVKKYAPPFYWMARRCWSIRP